MSFQYRYLKPTEWRLFLTVWLVYLFHLTPFTGANENRYLDLVRSIVDEGRFEIDTYHHNTIDKAYRDGHYYAGAAPGPAFLAVPAYAIFKAVEPVLPPSLFSQYDKTSYIRGYLQGKEASDEFVEQYPFGRFILSHFLLTALTCSLLSAVTVVLLYRIMLQLNADRTWALLISLAYAFGTTLFYYSTRLYPHVLGGGFAFLAFVLIASRRMADRPITQMTVVWAGLCLGMAVFMDYAVVPTAGCVGLYMLMTIRDRRLLYGVLAGLIPVGMLLVYHAICFGSPIKTAYGFPNGPVDDGTHLYYNQNFHGFSFPPLSQIWGLSFSVWRGLFWYMPVSILAVFALIKELLNGERWRLEWVIITCLVLSQFLFNAMMHPNYWYGGWEFGPRFLTPMAPFIMLPLGLIVLKTGRWAMMAYGLIVVSVFINWIGVQYAPSHSLFGTIILFFMSGPSTPLYLFLENYFRTYTAWSIEISPLGGYLALSVLLWFLWKRPSLSVKES